MGKKWVYLVVTIIWVAVSMAYVYHKLVARYSIEIGGEGKREASVVIDLPFRVFDSKGFVALDAKGGSKERSVMDIWLMVR